MAVAREGQCCRRWPSRGIDDGGRPGSDNAAADGRHVESVVPVPMAVTAGSMDPLPVGSDAGSMFSPMAPLAALALTLDLDRLGPP